MKYLELMITVRAPLSLGRQKLGSISETEHYIPGTAIRGAIAGHLLRQTGHTQTDLSTQGGDFQTLFLDENAAIFQNAYPAIAKIDESKSQLVEEQVFVIPATAVSSKNNPGFKQANSDKGGVFDTLIDRFCADQCGYPYDPSCPKDQSRVEPYSGFYSKLADPETEHQYPYRSHVVSTRFLTRVGINRRRATAQDALLYSIEVLNEAYLPNLQSPRWEPVAYRGGIKVFDDTLAHKLEQMITRHADAFRIGGSASRGLGKVYFQITTPKENKSLKNRLNLFNEVLLERLQCWTNLFGDGQTIEIKKRTFFTLDLQADTILTDCWRRTTVITQTMLKKIVGLPTNLDVELHASYSSYDYRGGWNTALGLMKDIELITNSGAVYLFSIPTNQLEDWLPKLAELEVKGVGDRTSEGYGQLQVCNEFHLVLREGAQ